MWKIFYTRDLCLRAHDTNSLCAGVCVEMRVNMNKNEWYQVGEDIKKQVQQAIDSNDFSELSKKIWAESKHRGVSPGFLDPLVGVQVPGAKQPHECSQKNRQFQWCVSACLY